MGRISKKTSVYTGKKNVDITNIINSNQIGGTNNKYNNNKSVKGKKNILNDSEFGSDDDDDDEYDESENDDDNDDNDDNNDNDDDDDDNDDNPDDEQNNDENENEDNYSEKSEKESNMGDDENIDDGDNEKNYIGDEETLKTKCYSNYAKVDYDELDFDELFGEETLMVDKNIRVSKPVLTKYEFVRLLTDRTKQLAQGAKQMLKNTQELSSKEIAKLEIKEGVIPLIIERPIPNSKSERWKVSELHIPEHFFSM